MTPLPVRLACLSLIGAALTACAPRGTYPAHPLGLQHVHLASYPSPVQPPPTPAPSSNFAAAPMQDAGPESTAAAPVPPTMGPAGPHRPSGLPGLQHVDLASYPSPIPPGSTTAGTSSKAAKASAATPPPSTVRPHSGSTPPAIARPTYAQDMDRMRRIEDEARRDNELRLDAMAREMERDRHDRERQREQDRLEQEYREAALRDQMERDRRYHQEREQERERERARDKDRERDRQREEARRDQERHDHARNREQAQREQAQRDQADRERRERERDTARRDQERRDQQAEREREQARRDQMERDRKAAADRVRNERPMQYGPGPAPTDWRARQQSNSLEKP